MCRCVAFLLPALLLIPNVLPARATEAAAPTLAWPWRGDAPAAAGAGQIATTTRGEGDEFWSDEFPLPISDGYVEAMTRYRGDLIVGGTFHYMAGVAANGIARWDGTTWSPLGAGVDGEVRALAVLGDSLIVGGTFRSAGGVSAIGIAAWNGIAWTSIAPLSNAPYYVSMYVLALLEHEGTLYVGGSLNVGGHPGLRGIVRWDGAQWDSLGMGVDGTVYAITRHEGSLYAGGQFNVAGTSAAASVAEWNGADWLPLAGGIENPPYGYPLVKVLASFGGRLYAGGYVGIQGGPEGGGLAAWDGSAWSVPDIAPLQPVWCLEPYGSRLAMASWGGILAWDGAAEVDTIRGIDGTPMALRAEGGELLACGDIRVVPAYGSPEFGDPPSAFRVARWDGSSWHGFESWTSTMKGLGSVRGGPAGVYGIRSYKGKLLAAGDDINTGDEGRLRKVGPLAQWNGSAWSEFTPPLPEYAFPRNMVVDRDTIWLAGSFYGGIRPPYGSHSVIQYNGSTWSALDTLPTWPNALVKFDGTLYAALRPYSFPDAQASIARRVGGRWETMATVEPDYYSSGVQRFVLFRGRLVAIGSFRAIDGVPLARIGEWDGTGWRPLQYGFENCSNSGTGPPATVFRDRLLVAPICNYPPFNRSAIASWDGREWSPLPGIRGRVTDMEAAGGLLFVVGEFTLAETGESATTASWDGFKWTRLGSGIALAYYRMPSVFITEHAGEVYFGGPFFEAGGKSSVGIARWSGPLPTPLSRLPWLSAGRPNPFRAASDLTFRLDVEASVRVAVYDVRGREVVVLDEGFRVPGSHAIRWDGRDRSSRLVPSGVYFISVRTRAGEVASQKVVRLR